VIVSVNVSACSVRSSGFKRRGAMSKSDHSFESYFNRLNREAKIRLANRRIQKIEADIKWCDVFGITHEMVKGDDWYLYDPAQLIEMCVRWYDVRDRLVWDNEEVML
jgi:hypothetical protein